MDDEVSKLAYQQSVSELLERAFAPWNPIPPERWSEEIRRMKGGLRFKWAYAPYLREMFLSMFDPVVIATIFELFSRAGKSEIVLNAIGWTIDQRPRRILNLWPTTGQAEKFSKDNLTGELFDPTECLNYLGTAAQKKTSGQTILHKIFPGGLMDMFGANAPGDMRRAKGDFLYGEEVDAIGSEQTDEGDQLAIFNKRGDEYPDCVRVFCSYPSIKGKSRIHAMIEESDYRQWFVTCVKCGGEPFVMHRRQNLYDKHSPHLARMECPRCKAQLTDRERYAMMMGGDPANPRFDLWQPTKEFRGKRGFQANAMLWPHPVDEKKYPGGLLQMIAQQEIDAEKSDNPERSKRVIVNTFDAEPYDTTREDEKPPDWKPLFDRREEYPAQVPGGALALTCFVDLQINRFELEWRGWGRGEESWGIDYVVIDGDIRNSVEPWNDLGRELAREFEHESGATISLSFALVDGGKWGDAVYKWLRRIAQPEHRLEGVTGKVRASKGVGQHGHPVIDLNYRTIAKQLKGHNIGTWAAKDLIYNRLRLKEDEDGEFPEGYCHFPKIPQYGENYFRMLTVEKKTVEFKGGEEIVKFINPDGARNEPLDTFVGTLAAFRRRVSWNWDLIEQDLKARAAVAKGEAEEIRRPQGAVIVSSGGSWGI